jgi:hypothetical protein
MQKVLDLRFEKNFTEQIFMNLALHEGVFFEASPVFLKRLLLEFPVVAQINMARYRERVSSFDFSRQEWELFKKSVEAGPIEITVFVEHMAALESKLESVWSAAELKAKFTKGEKPKAKAL